MTSGADDFCPHRFSTDDLPERDRVAIWREVFGRRMLKAQFEVLPGARFHTATFRRMPGLALGFSAAKRGIGALAPEAGFGDLSYFNRAFRRRYGASPSDVRAAATDGSQRVRLQ